MSDIYIEREIQISKDSYLLVSRGTLLGEVQVEPIPEETLKRYLKEFWTSVIIPEL